MGENTKRRRGRPGKEAAAGEPPANTRWRNGRAYIDARAWAAWGGGQEPLVAEGQRWATDDEHTAAILFGRRLEQLREQRRLYPDGIPAAQPKPPTEPDPLDRIAAFAGYHLSRMQEARPEGSQRREA